MLSFIPLLAWSLWCGYILLITKDLLLTQTYQNHEKIVNALVSHYQAVVLLWLLAMALTGIMLVYNVIHLAKLKPVHGATKLGWMVFMVVFGPISFPIFWYMQIKDEPKNIPTYADIT